MFSFRELFAYFAGNVFSVISVSLWLTLRSSAAKLSLAEDERPVDRIVDRFFDSKIVQKQTGTLGQIKSSLESRDIDTTGHKKGRLKQDSPLFPKTGAD